MLRLVGAREQQSTSERIRTIAFVALDEELADYIEWRLRVRWPGLRIRRVDEPANIAASHANLVISSLEPETDPILPTLWLSQVERRSRPFHVGNRLWKCATPISGTHLVKVIDHMARSIQQ